MPLSAQFAGDFDGAAYAGNGVVSVHQKNAVVRHRFCVGFERLTLLLEKHDPTVSLCSAYRDPELLSCLQIRCSGAATNVSGTGCRQSTVYSLRSAETKLDHRIVFSSQTNARRFSCDHALKIENIEQGCFE